MSQSELTTILEGRKSKPHQLIEVLQDIQAREGYVSESSMRDISKELGVPLTEVYAVASFSRLFH